MAKAGRPPAIEGHPKRDQILEALLTPGANMAAIQREFGISEKALETFRRKYVTAGTRAMLDRVATAVPIATAQLDIMARLDNLIALTEKMLSAVDAWLEDPNAPGHYNLNPRTHEVDVVWEREIPIGDGDRTRTERKVEKLSKLLSDVEAGLGITVTKGETKIADPRRLLLEAVATMKPVAELLGKARGEIKPDPGATVNVFLGSKEWDAMQAAIVEAVRPWPPALEAAGRALATIGSRDDGR